MKRSVQFAILSHVFLLAVWGAGKEQPESAQWCARQVSNWADFDQLQLDYLGKSLLAKQGTRLSQYAFGDDLLQGLAVLSRELPQGAGADARVGVEYLLGKIMVGRVHLDDIPYRENGHAAYVGRVIKAEGKLHQRGAMAYRVTLRTANQQFVETDLLPSIQYRSGQDSQAHYYVHIIKDPAAFTLPELSGDERQLISQLPDGKFGSEESGEDWQSGMSAREAHEKFGTVIVQGGWTRGVPAYSLTSTKALEDFLKGKIITFPEFLSTTGGLISFTVSTEKFEADTTLKIVSGQVIDATVSRNNVGSFHIDAFLMTTRGARRETLFYPERIFWRGVVKEDPHALAARDLKLFEGVSLEPTFIYQKAEGPTTYGSATIINAFASGSTGADQAKKRIQSRISEELTARGGRIVRNGLPQLKPGEPIDLSAYVGKLALIVQTRGESRERANVVPKIGKIIQMDIVHSSRMTRSDEIPVTFLSLRMHTPEGISQEYIEYAWTTSDADLTIFE